MKKILAILLCAAMCLTFAACGEKPEDSGATKPSTSVTEPSSTPETTPAETEAPAVGDGTEMEAFIESIQDSIDGVSDSLESSGLKLEVVARGNSLVYSYQYTVDVGDTSAVKDALEQSMEGVASTFESILSALKLAVPDAESVIVEYLDQGGNLILSKEYK